MYAALSEDFIQLNSRSESSDSCRPGLGILLFKFSVSKFNFNFKGSDCGWATAATTWPPNNGFAPAL